MWIYVFLDNGYEQGVKVGRSSSRHGAWDDAPSYSPRPMRYAAGWEINLGVGQTASSVEREIHGVLGPALVYPRNGREWFDVAQEEAIERISEKLGTAPEGRNLHVNRVVTNDQFRNPHPRRAATNRFRTVAWVYQEHMTGRLKTQVIDDWTTPLETRRRYSRNGFAECAAFTAPDDEISRGNLATQGAWERVMDELCGDHEDGRYGWLPEGARLEDVAAIYRAAGLVSIDMDRARPYPGVKPAYNRSVPQTVALGT